MTVASEDPAVETYAGNGVTTDFPFPHYVELASYLVVIHISSTDVRTTLVLDSDYSVADIGSTGGPTITYPISGSPLASGATLLVYLDLPLLQSDDYRNDDDGDANVYERRVDYLTRLCIQLKEEIDRAPKVLIGSTTNPDDLMDDLYDARDEAVTAATNADDDAVATAADRVAVEAAAAGLSYTTKAQAQALTLTTGITAPAILRDIIGRRGECRFDYVSATVARLNRYNGHLIQINGALYEIPAAGVDFSPGASASTLYYAYIYSNAGTLTGELSATVYSADTTAGNEGVMIKSGDATRTLVGLVYMNASTQFEYGYVLSWFNSKEIHRKIADNTVTSVSSASYTEFTSSGRLPFITFAARPVKFDWMTRMRHANSGATRGLFGVAIDGTSLHADSPEVAVDYVLGGGQPLRMITNAISDGPHYATLIGKSSGTAGAFHYGESTAIYTNGIATVMG
jgi:hypothetical protein